MHNGFIVFEGVDGAGKSTVAQLVAQALQQDDPGACYWDKRATHFDSQFARQQMETIKAALWDYQKDANILELGNMHWLSLMCSWFSAIDELVVKPARAQQRTLVMDNWHYKFSSRFLLKDDFDPALVRMMFSQLTRPDRIVFLQVDPATAAERKGGVFQPSECGVLAAPHLAGRASFMAYQAAVQQQLLAVCDSAQTLLVDASEGSAEHVAAAVLAQLRA
ncbi:Thymidylate kinase [Duganella sp. CF458]|uniref:AAA family ATPase n=1 Tax=Duganella sp. CF458 TaxID=1884368 RepID=UPI0008E8FAD9|nr:AAA family ATPase [Duganella sp. CF458]SFG37609.1 Thymidylate kinase [Duganella sp. CF458]